MNAVVVSAPLFALVFLGYVATRLKLIPISALPGLNSYVLYFAITAMLFRLGAANPASDMVNLTLMGVWMAGAWLVLVLGIVPGLRAGLGWRTSSFAALGGSSPNLGFMGIPLIAAIMGEGALSALMPILIVDIVLLQSTALALAHQGGDRKASAGRRALESMRGIVANPLLWSMALGACWGATGLAMAEPVEKTISLLASSATPVALVTIGGVLAREQSTAKDTGKRAALYISWLTLLKLLAQPCLVWLIGQGASLVGIPIDGRALTVLVLLAALPTAANTSILAERFRADNAIVASVILTSTTAGFLTFNAIAAVVT